MLTLDGKGARPIKHLMAFHEPFSWQSGYTGNMSIPLTKKQPPHWPRKRIGDCFSISSILTGGVLNFQPGDIQVVAKQGQMTATVVDEASVQTHSGTVRMRGNGTLLPQLMAQMINHPDVQQSMWRFAEAHGSVVFRMNISFLRDIEIAVPDPQTQAMMTRAIEQSHQFLIEHTSLLRRQADTLDKMANAILHQVLIGQADRKQALTWVGQALAPLGRLGDIKDGVGVFSSQEAGQAGEGASFVRLEDHQHEVARLTARVKELEAQAPAQPDEAKPRSPGM